jgi:peptidoglycan hydrolase CwlO-like protein
MKAFVFFVFLSSMAQAEIREPYLTAEDQKYYKNEAGTGMNQLERIDSNVKELNKLHAEIASMKAEIQELKKEINEMKKPK